ncbi:diguanylate cyclase domain-containing protein [Phytohalomonas tamaricis]|uniref:diguanylate cyclase domain-containing protein n=1 Tax=Phytohalomonas tamaricis TaxID=2081032 RepID=UPI000D0ACC18|nr:diguanylate cyclase [Phytohalomonas tamaricis]
MNFPTSLRRRFIATMATTFAIVLAALVYLFQYIMLPTLTLEEDHNARISLNHVQNIIDDELYSLALTTKSWATWDDAFAFMQGIKQDFPQRFITPELFQELGLSLVVFTDKTDMVSWVAGFDPVTGSFTSCHIPAGKCAWSFALVKTLQSAMPRRDLMLMRRSQLITSPTLAMISQWPILHGDGSGPVAGRLTMVKAINEHWMTALRQKTGFDVTLSDSQVPVRKDADQIEVKRMDTSHLRATRLQPAPPFGHQLLTEIKLPRDRLHDGIATYYIALFAIVGLLGLTLAVSLATFQRLVLNPITKLTAYAQQLHQQKDDIETPTDLLARHDELGTMAREFQYLINYHDDRAASLKALTYKDALTGLGNRRLLDERLPQILSLTHRLEYPVALIMIDVDHFKAYNDCYGHPEGDRCLKALAETLSDLFQRESDLIARIGGEEFVIVLPDVDPERAIEIASGVRTAIEAQCIPHECSPTHCYVTISVGVAISWPSHNRTLGADELIKQADQALYDAKRIGRNTIGYAHSLAELATPA